MRVAHVSDLHLLALDGARLGDFVLNKRATGGLNLLFNRGRHYQADVFAALVDDLNALGVDHVVCTGDVTNLSLEPEFRFARGHFDRIAVGPTHVTCIPGNHDNYVAEVAGLFEQVFEPYCAADEAWRWPDGGRWPVVRVRGDVALIGLSTSQATGWLYAHGTLGGEQLGRLERILGDPRLEGKFRIVLLHHPPAGKYARHVLRGLRDHATFAQVIARTGAELVLHGHEHLDLKHTLGGPGGAIVPVHGIPSGSYDREHPRRQARYRVYTIAERGGPRGRVVEEQLRIWRPATRRFETDGAASVHAA